MLDNFEQIQLKTILYNVIYACDHLSASSGGLKERKRRLKKAKSILHAMLNIDSDDQEQYDETLYTDYMNIEDKT